MQGLSHGGLSTASLSIPNLSGIEMHHAQIDRRLRKFNGTQHVLESYFALVDGVLDTFNYSLCIDKFCTAVRKESDRKTNVVCHA